MPKPTRFSNQSHQRTTLKAPGQDDQAPSHEEATITPAAHPPTEHAITQHTAAVLGGGIVRAQLAIVVSPSDHPAAARDLHSAQATPLLLHADGAALGRQHVHGADDVAAGAAPLRQRHAQPHAVAADGEVAAERRGGRGRQAGRLPRAFRPELRRVVDAGSRIRGGRGRCWTCCGDTSTSIGTRDSSSRGKEEQCCGGAFVCGRGCGGGGYPRGSVSEIRGQGWRRHQHGSYGEGAGQEGSEEGEEMMTAVRDPAKDTLYDRRDRGVEGRRSRSGKLGGITTTLCARPMVVSKQSAYFGRRNRIVVDISMYNTSMIHTLERRLSSCVIFTLTGGLLKPAIGLQPRHYQHSRVSPSGRRRRRRSRRPGNPRSAPRRGRSASRIRSTSRSPHRS